MLYVMEYLQNRGRSLQTTGVSDRRKDAVSFGITL